MVEMDDKTEGMLAIVAALLVLAANMLDPTISLALSVLFLVCLAAYKFLYAYEADKEKAAKKK